MHIAVVGTGYVGLVSAVCFADLGHDVTGVDIDKEKIQKLQNSESPIFEPGLEELLKNNLKQKRLRFTTDIAAALPEADAVFCAVATPPGKDQSADLNAVFAVTRAVAEHADHDLVFVNKSTVPVGTGKKCKDLIDSILAKRGVNYDIPVVSNPEFLREGMAITDTLMPDRIIIGVNGNDRAKEMMEELYKPITRVGKPLIFMGRESAEIVKYASNAFLATKISFINMLSELAEKTGANIRDVSRGIGLDDRIGPRFLHAGIGYGGSCFPKDVKALIATAKELGIPMPIVEATDAVNRHQRERFIKLILASIPKKSVVAVWGLSFKPKTDDMRDAPSIDIINALLKAGHSVQAYDPASMDRAKNILPQEVQYCADHMEAAKDARAIVVLTEWDVFRGINLSAVKKAMKGDLLLDGRNVYDPKEVKEAQLQYKGIGI